jgi:hypothetical protein
MRAETGDVSSINPYKMGTTLKEAGKNMRWKRGRRNRKMMEEEEEGEGEEEK